jgi:CRISPR-associated endonuclease/helicase Cas3
VWEDEAVPSADLGGGAAMPATRLDLAPMEMGEDDHGRPSWTERMVALRDRLGPFRLAYLEALLIAADWRASAKAEVDAAAGRKQ